MEYQFMTKEERIKATVETLEEVTRTFGRDIEGAHSMADDILCNLLVSLGYKEVVDAWEEVPKWYA
jgi:hypothetical protein